MAGVTANLRLDIGGRIYESQIAVPSWCSDLTALDYLTGELILMMSNAEAVHGAV